MVEGDHPRDTALLDTHPQPQAPCPAGERRGLRQQNGRILVDRRAQRLGLVVRHGGGPVGCARFRDLGIGDQFAGAGRAVAPGQCQVTGDVTGVRRRAAEQVAQPGGEQTQQAGRPLEAMSHQRRGMAHDRLLFPSTSDRFS